MKATDKIDAARVDLLLGELRLPGIKLIWAALAATADKEGWPAAQFLAALAEQEMVERNRRRFERHLEEARLPPGKTLDTFDFTAVPMISKAQVQALAAGDAWLERGANLLCFGPPGAGKSHLAAALGLTLIEKGWRVLFTRTTDLVQKLQIARRDLALEAAIAKLDKYHLLILDDLAYVTKDQAETSVLFELISARYERRSLLITANQPLLGEWGKVFTEHYASTILAKMLTPFESGFVDLRSPAGIGIAAIVYNYDGDVYASDEARMLAEMGDKTFRLGSVHQDQYEDLLQKDILLDSIENSFAASAPMCSECAFEPFCGADPVFHYATQGDVVGLKPVSGFCIRNMTIFRRLIALLRQDDDTRNILLRWANTRC